MRVAIMDISPVRRAVVLVTGKGRRRAPVRPPLPRQSDRSALISCFLGSAY